MANDLTPRILLEITVMRTQPVDKLISTTQFVNELVNLLRPGSHEDHPDPMRPMVNQQVMNQIHPRDALSDWHTS